MPNNNETYITGLRVVKGRKKSQCLNLSNARIKPYAEIEQMTEDELQGVIICPDYPLEDGHLVPSSAIGYEDGTVEDALDDLYEAGNVRYNSETDRFEVKVNGTWVPSVKAYASNLVLFDGTSFYESYENGVYKPLAGYVTLAGGFTINLPQFIAPRISSGQLVCRSFVFENLIDMSDYTSLVVETSDRTYTLNITNVNNGYICMYTGSDSNNTKIFGVYVSSAKENFLSSSLAYDQNTNMASDITINRIYLVK